MATRYFATGFLAGNLPPAPSEDGDPSGETLAEWERAAERFAAEGVWLVEVDLDEPWRRTEAQFVSDAVTLANIGSAIADQVSPIAVTLPAELAADALEAARRTQYTFGAERLQLARERAAALAFIGKALDQEANSVDPVVAVTLDVILVGQALEALQEDWARSNDDEE